MHTRASTRGGAGIREHARWGTHADEREAEWSARERDGIVEVLDPFEDHLDWWLVDPAPLDDVALDVVHRLEDRPAVAHVVKQVGDVSLEAERVDPHAEGAFLARVALVLLGQLFEELRRLRLVGRLEAGARVEQRRHESEIQLLAASHDIFWL